MEITNLGNLVSTLGFPISMAVYFVWQNKQQTDKLIEIAKQASVDSAASTEAINKATSTIQRNTIALEHNSEAFNKLTGIIDARGR